MATRTSALSAALRERPYAAAATAAAALVALFVAVQSRRGSSKPKVLRSIPSPRRHSYPTPLLRPSCSVALPSRSFPGRSRCGYSIWYNEGVRVGARRREKSGCDARRYNTSANAWSYSRGVGEERVQSHTVRYVPPRSRTPLSARLLYRVC